MNDKFEKFISCIEDEFILVRVNADSITDYLSPKYNELLVEKTPLLNYLINKEAKTHFEKYFLSLHCLFGIDGVTIDIQVAFGKISRLAEAKYPPAIFALAVIYNEGLAGKFDQNKAFDLFLQGYELKFLPSYCALARCYSWGYGILQDKVMAISIFEEAIKLGYIPAEFSYGEELITQISASEEIYQRGLKLIFGAAGKCDINAIKFIAGALCGYSRFKDRVADYIKANKHTNKEVYVVAEFLLYYKHISPKFTVPSENIVVEDVAIKLLKVLGSYPKAVRLLAYCYEEGIGVSRDMSQALRLLRSLEPKRRPILQHISASSSIQADVIGFSLNRRELAKVMLIKPPSPELDAQEVIEK